MKNPENRNHIRKNKRKTRKIRPVPILMAGLFIDVVFLSLTAFFLGTLAYFFQWKIEHFQTTATVIYLFAIYLSSLLVSLIAGNRYPLVPLANGLICLTLSLIPLAANHIPPTENLLTKIGFVIAASLAAYLTIRLFNMAAAPKKTRQRIPIAERSRTLESNSIEIH